MATRRWQIFADPKPPRRAPMPRLRMRVVAARRWTPCCRGSADTGSYNRIQAALSNPEARVRLNDRIPPTRIGQEMAAALGLDARLRGDGGPGEAEVLLPRNVRVSVRPCARRSRSQLHHRGRDGAHQADARLQRAASFRMGRLWPAG